MILQSIIEFFAPRKIKPKITLKTPFQQFLEKTKYNPDKDLLVLPEGYLASSSFRPKNDQVIYLRYLTNPAVIKS